MKRSNQFICISFFCIIICTAIGSKFYNSFSDIVIAYMDVSVNGKTSQDLKTLSTDVLNTLPYKNKMVDLSGDVLKLTGTRSYYFNLYGLNITTDGYSVGRYNKTSTDYEVEQIAAFKEYLDAKGISLLYVSEPAKYIDDDYYLKQFGNESYLNRNTDLFLSRISEKGIEYLDLRDSIKNENIEPMSLFYKTDHHWTVPASLWAAGKVAEKINRSFSHIGYNIDLSLYDERNYNMVEYNDSWLGEQGRLMSAKYIGLDDYTMMEPKFSTDYKVLADDQSIVTEGDFGIFINKSVYETEGDCYSGSSWHYSYQAYNNMTIHNDNAGKGNVLVLGDSYESSMGPFLSLGFQDVKVVVLRDLTESVRDIIEAGDFDMVIIAYAQFMIGAHDDSASSNYKMFTLE